MLEISLHHGQKPVGKLELLKVKEKKLQMPAMNVLVTFILQGGARKTGPFH